MSTYTVGTGKTYSTIQAAINAAQDDYNGIILIDPGTYNEELSFRLVFPGSTVDFAGTLKSSISGQKVIIDGTGKSTGAVDVNAQKSASNTGGKGIYFEDFIFQNWNSSTNIILLDPTAPFASDRPPIGFTKCIFKDSTATAISYFLGTSTYESYCDRCLFLNVGTCIENASQYTRLKNCIFVPNSNNSVITQNGTTFYTIIENCSAYVAITGSIDAISAKNVYNTVVVNNPNSTSLGKAISLDPLTGKYGNNAVYGNFSSYFISGTSDGGNFTGIDPLLINPSVGNFNFKTNSILKGNGKTIQSVGNDYFGNVRQKQLSGYTYPAKLKYGYDIGAVAREFKSGFLNLPPRVQLQKNDLKVDASGQNNLRTANKDFNGKLNIFFDDTNTQFFKTNTNIVLPIGLNETSKFISGTIVNSKKLRGLSVAGTDNSFAYEQQTNLTAQTQTISPFDESRVYIESNDSFFLTGTETDTLENFSQKLSNKNQIVFDINPTVSTDVFFSTGTVKHTSPYANRDVGLQNGINSGIAYFNWINKKWEIIGDLTTGSNVDFLNPNPDTRSSSIHGFTGIAEFFQAVSPSSYFDTSYHIGRPHSTHGFPFATQYNATGSQQLCLSGVITEPFLLEKVVLEFSSSFPAFNSTTQDGPLSYQFFLLNSRDVPIVSVDLKQNLTGTSTGLNPTSRTKTFTVTQPKDIIWTGDIGRYNTYYTTGSGGYGSEIGHLRDLNLKTTTGTSVSAITGSFLLKSSPKIFANQDGIISLSLRSDSTNVPLMANNLGGRNFIGEAEGRSFIRSVVGIGISGSLNTGNSSSSATKYTINKSNSVFKISPYILLPTDKIILGFCNQPLQSNHATYTNAFSENNIKQHVVTLLQGKGKLTFYGSSLLDGKPKEFQFGDNLNSNIINEVIEGEPICDVFDVEPEFSFSGSFYDCVFNGSIFNTGSTSVRGKIASTVTNQSGATGSFSRNVKINCESLIYYDSVTPSLANLFVEYPPYISGSNYVYYHRGTIFGSPLPTGSSWYNEPGLGKTINYKRNINLTNKNFYVDGGGSSITQTSIAFLPELSGTINTTIGIVSGSIQKSLGIKSFFAPESSTPLVVGEARLDGSEDEIKSINKILFGAPKPNRQLPIRTINSVNSFIFVNAGVVPNLRGFKYGLMNALPSNKFVIFNRKHYGHFRDIFESSPEGLFLNKENNLSESAPVKIIFEKDNIIGVDPENTNSQNLSQFATSSMPYVDGITVDRITTTPDEQDNLSISSLLNVDITT